MPYVHLEPNSSAIASGIRLINPTDRVITLIIEPLKSIEIHHERKLPAKTVAKVDAED